MLMAKNAIKIIQGRGQPTSGGYQKGLIITPGAIGDCICMLPLVRFMKDVLRIQRVDLAARCEYVDFWRGRTAIDEVRSIESIELHKLFVGVNDFDIFGAKSIATAFSGYEWIVSFIGEAGSDFEKNLVMTVYSTHSAEIFVLPLHLPDGYKGHVSQYHIRKFVEECTLDLSVGVFDDSQILISAHADDIDMGRDLLAEAGIDADERLVILGPGSGGKAKCWHLDNYLGVAACLGEMKSQVVWLLGPAEEERFSEKQKASMEEFGTCITGVGLEDVMRMMVNADLYIGNDSGPTHMAGALGVGTVAIFGVTNSRQYRPIGPNVTVLETNGLGFDKACVEEQEHLIKIIELGLND
jgi:heptosyltransferase-3